MTLQSSQPILYQGNPLEDMSLTRFLDRFVYRNPKKLESHRRIALERTTPSNRFMNALPVNSNAFINQPIGTIPPDEVRNLTLKVQAPPLEVLHS